MQRVHLIRALRFAISGSAASTLFSFLAVWEISREVWVAKVIENAPANVLDLPHFYWSAFGNTSVLVQALVVLVLVCALFVAREVSRAISVVARAEPS